MRSWSKNAVWLVMAGLLAPASAATISLALSVRPEARVTPASVPITFEVSDTGFVTSQPITVEAWFRALPNQTTSLNVSVSDLAGPVTLSGSEVQWEGAEIAGTGGGKNSQCCSWTSPGKATIRIAFSALKTSGWKPGIYSARADFRLLATGGR